MSEKSEQHTNDGTLPLLAPFQDNAEHLHTQSTTNPTLSEQVVPNLVASSAKSASSSKHLFDTGINLEVLLDREINALSSSELFAVPQQETYEGKEPPSSSSVASVPFSSPVVSALPSSSSLPSQPSALFSTLWMGSAGLPVNLDESSPMANDTDGTLSDIPSLRFLPPTDSTDHHESWPEEDVHRESQPKEAVHREPQPEADHHESWPEEELSRKDTPHDQGAFSPEASTGSQPQIEEYPDEVLFSGSYQDLAMLSARSAFHSFRPIPSPEPTSQPSIPSLSAAKPASTTETQHTARPDTTPTQTQPSYREPLASPSGPNYLETSVVTPFPKAPSSSSPKPLLTETAEMDLSPDHPGNQWEQEAPMSTTTQDSSLHTSSHPPVDQQLSARETHPPLSLSSTSVQESSDPILYSTFTESFTISAQEKNMQLPSAWQTQLKPLTHESFELEPQSISPPSTEARSSVLFLLLLILFSVIAISVWLLTALHR